MIALNPVTVILIPFYAHRRSDFRPQFFIVCRFLPGEADNNLHAVKTCGRGNEIRHEREQS